LHRQRPELSKGNGAGKLSRKKAIMTGMAHARGWEACPRISLKDVYRKEMSFFQPNIGSKGRVLRGIAALAFLLGALGLWWWEGPLFLVIGLAVASGFTAFEAGRGWCVARACGIKTKI
jgi:hypothetical protein